MAVYCFCCPAGTVALAGVTVISSRTAAVMVSVVLLLIVLRVADISVLPTATGVAWPFSPSTLLMDAIKSSLEDHVTC